LRVHGSHVRPVLEAQLVIAEAALSRLELIRSELLELRQTVSIEADDLERLLESNAAMLDGARHLVARATEALVAG
jgi:hypothetical protein